MRTPQSIRIEDTLRRKWVVRDYGTFEWVDWIIAGVFFGGLGYCFCQLLFHANQRNVNERFLTFSFYPLVIAFCAYGLYRLVTENSFQRVRTPFAVKENRQLILDLIELRGMRRRKAGPQLIIATEQAERTLQVLTFLVEDGLIRSNLLTNRRKLFCPALFSHLLLQLDIRQAVKRYQPHHA